MKCNLTYKGKLEIQTDTEAEYYALKSWQNECHTSDEVKIILPSHIEEEIRDENSKSHDEGPQTGQD